MDGQEPGVREGVSGVWVLLHQALQKQEVLGLRSQGGGLVSLGWEEGSPTPEAGRPREGWCCYRQGGSWQGGAAEGQALPQLASPFCG